MKLTLALRVQGDACLDQLKAVIVDLDESQLAFTDARLDGRSIAGVAMRAADSLARLSAFVAQGGGQRTAPLAAGAGRQALIDALAGARL